jgi:dTDP-4-dehydrorhamnose reductase
MSETQTNHVYLIYGKTGWIGGILTGLLTEAGKTFHLANARLDNRDECAQELDAIQPTHVLCAAGLTGRPNVDWCEDHKEEVLRTNVMGTLSLADLCASRNIHLTLFATGCIYEYDEAHPMYSGIGFTEEDAPNFTGSFYSYTKGVVEGLLRVYPNLLVLRVRMPISDDLCPRNFITKIVKYEKVVNIPNSMTVLHDLLPVSLTMAERSLVGVFNFCNPGVISHNEILDLYREHIDSTFTYQNFTLEEQDVILKAKRSNNELDCTKLVEALPDLNILPIQEAIVGVFQRMRVNLENEGLIPDGLPQRK